MTIDGGHHHLLRGFYLWSSMDISSLAINIHLLKEWLTFLNFLIKVQQFVWLLRHHLLNCYARYNTLITRPVTTDMYYFFVIGSKFNWFVSLGIYWIYLQISNSPKQFFVCTIVPRKNIRYISAKVLAQDKFETVVSVKITGPSF